jgi:hypothetical protein
MALAAFHHVLVLVVGEDGRLLGLLGLQGHVGWAMMGQAGGVAGQSQHEGKGGGIDASLLHGQASF